MSELRGVKFELKIEELILNQVIMELCLQTYLYYNLKNMHKYLIVANGFNFYRPTFFTASQLCIHVLFSS